MAYSSSSSSSIATGIGNVGNASNAAASQALAVDGRALNALKVQAGKKDGTATREAAKQFESLFMREMIKSMREATMKSGLLEGAEGNLASDMLDQQLSVQMAGLPGGLTEAIQRQLARQMGAATDSEDVSLSVPSTLSWGALRKSTSAAKTTASATLASASTAATPKGLESFVQHHSTAAQKVAQESGIPAAFMLGQAGHETGWGKSEIRNSDGSTSYNLFGIKATKGWTGKVAEIMTTEYEGGVARKVSAKFRAYDSYEESFRDYARLIAENPRYDKAMEQLHSAQAYASELQKAGYATDPAYANKLSRAIQSTLQVSQNKRGQGIDTTA